MKLSGSEKRAAPPSRLLFLLPIDIDWKFCRTGRGGDWINFSKKGEATITTKKADSSNKVAPRRGAKDRSERSLRKFSTHIPPRVHIKEM